MKTLSPKMTSILMTIVNVKSGYISVPYTTYTALRDRGLIISQIETPTDHQFNATWRWQPTSAGYQYASDHGWLVEYDRYAAELESSVKVQTRIMDDLYQASEERERMAAQQAAAQIEVEAPAVEPEQEQSMSTEPQYDVDNLSEAELTALKKLFHVGAVKKGGLPEYIAPFEMLVARGFAYIDAAGFYESSKVGRDYLRTVEAANDEQPAPTFQQGQRVKITNINRPRFGQVGTITGYDPAQKLYNVLFMFSSSDYTEDELMPEWTPGSGTHPVLDMLSKLNIDELSPIEAYTKLYELKRLL